MELSGLPSRSDRCIPSAGLCPPLLSTSWALPTAAIQPAGPCPPLPLSQLGGAHRCLQPDTSTWLAQTLIGADLIIRLSLLAAEAGLSPPTQPPPPRPNTSCTYPVFDPSDTPAAPSPLRADAWTSLLDGYPDRTFVDNILGMIRHGAKLGYDGPLLQRGRAADLVPNHALDEEGQAHVRHTIDERVLSGQAVRVQPPEDARLVVSPIGTVPKANGKRRTINDLSWPRRGPHATSVNSGISRERVSLRYDSLDHLFSRIRAAKRPMDIWKADLTDAFFHVSVASQDARLLGYHFEGTAYADCTLNFGGRSSPFLFNLFAEALHWILSSFGLDVTHYLDDSFGACPAGTGGAILAFFRAVCSSLGIAVSDTKSGTAGELEVLGIMVNSRTGRAWLSKAKLDKLRHQLDGILATPRAHPKELQALAGYLNFVSRVLPTGRAFLRRIYDATNASELDGASRSTTGALGDELRWWRSTLDRWDGVTIIPINQPRIELWSDAATTRGIGAHLGPRERCTAAMSLEVPARHQGKDILFLETLALLEALRRWAPELRGSEIMCKIDNAALVASLRSGRCHQRATMSLIREIMAVALELHLTLTPDWIPSAENDVADALSRFDWPHLLRHRPHVANLLPRPTAPPVPPVPRPSPLPCTPLPPPVLPYDLACYAQPVDG